MRTLSRRLPLVVLLALSIVSTCAPRVKAQGVPVVIYGHVYMPDGSPASGAQVSVSCSEDSASTTTNSEGYYQVTLTVSKSQIVTVTATKDDLSATKKDTIGPGTGSKEIDLVLSSGEGGGGGGWSGGGTISYIRILDVTAAEAALGQPVKLIVTVKNVGSYEARDLKILVYFENWTLLASGDLPGTLAPKEEKTFEFEIDSSKLGEGSFTLYVVVSSTLGSGMAQVRVKVVAKGLLEVFMSAPEQAAPGENVTINGTVRNVGAITVRDVVVSVYLMGERVASIPLGVLRPGEAREFSAVVTVPERGERLEVEVVVTGEPKVEVRVARTLTMVAVTKGAGGEVGPPEEAALDVEGAKTALQLAASILESVGDLADLSEELAELNSSWELLNEAVQAYERGEWGEANETIWAIKEAAHTILWSALEKASDSVRSRLEEARVSISDPRLQAALSAAEELLKVADRTEDPLEIARLLKEVNSVLDAVQKLSTELSEQETGGELPGAPPKALAPTWVTPAVGALCLALGALLGRAWARRS